MDFSKRISEVFNSSEKISFDDSSKIVLLSDCHRGNGSWADDFSNNQNLFFAALTYYYEEDFTYIELGDGDELWKNKNYSDIIHTHSDIFWLLSKFYNKGRIHFIYGNHDIEKKNDEFVKKNLYKYFDERENKEFLLFNNMKIHEGLILKHKVTGDEILLIHGHQVSIFNDRLWKINRFLVRYLWGPLNLFGVNDPTSTAKNYDKKVAVEDKLINWVKKEKHMLIAGHTHKPIFPEVDEVPYFNDGSCVHPRCITSIEIDHGDILLVKWSVKTKDDGTLYIGKDIIAGPRKIREYFK
ncbi:metallophosphoesterase family protein [Clostridium sp. SHJSY1]|uniref:metallophosphoesterase n=1 Tax=Clostridium sp. SHJSY1 TaxID=2942483 RepID=UPI0028741F45|nr:metallophosphoesterase [Clostridium sp. SHJSY1]MDS0525101.1 metallophosphoesterase family protein [Clostridium sp. SHJSY1]